MHRVPEGLKERFLRSKSGELVTDWYDDNPELNIVQQDAGTVYGKRTVVLDHVTCYGNPVLENTIKAEA